ncbi:MAG: hypothetical protein ACRCYY_21595, partial [Trueperaceae bacterium]
MALLLAACSQETPTAKPTPNAVLEAQETGSWRSLGDTLDVVSKNNVANAKMLLDTNGKLVVLWAEDNGLWYLQGKRWNGTAWEKLAFPTRPLAYTNEGVTPFDVVFDHSNALVITQPKNGNVNVEVLRSTTSWHSLGSFTRPNQLQTNSSGQ